MSERVSTATADSPSWSRWGPAVFVCVLSACVTTEASLVPSIVQRSEVEAVEYLVVGVPYSDYLEAPGRDLRVRDDVEVWVGPLRATIVSADSAGMRVRLSAGLAIGRHDLRVIGGADHERLAALQVVESLVSLDASTDSFASMDTADAGVADGASADVVVDATAIDAADATSLCASACVFSNATASCVDGECGIDACEIDYGDCDAVVSNGCEVDLSSAFEHCGRCGNSCGSGEECTVGACAGPGQRVRIAGGNKHTCAVVNGAVYCWGDNSDGQLGNGTTTRFSGAADTGLRGAVDVAAGEKYSCAVLGDGSVRCWGSNAGDVFGVRDSGGSQIPLVVPGVANALAISGGRQHVCAVLRSGEVLCWGDNAKGQLGIGVAGGKYPASRVLGVPTVLSIACGREHTCAVASGGTIHCWGDGSQGGLGQGETADSAVPLDIAWSGSLLALGDGFSCATSASGAASCWGQNSHGQLGQGNRIRSATPLPIPSLSGVASIAAGESFACSAHDSGTVRCWGRSAEGQVGSDADDNFEPAPLSVPGVDDALRVAAGDQHICAVRVGGEIVCWGGNDKGQLGNGDSEDSDVPVSVMGLP